MGSGGQTLTQNAMQKLSKEEVEKTVVFNNGRELWLTVKLKELQPGEGLIVKKTEWRSKSGPGRYARRLEKTLPRKFRCGRLADNSGWLLQRME